MTKKKDDLEPVWPKENLWERLTNCRAMLHAHGLISDDQNERVAERIYVYISKREKEKNASTQPTTRDKGSERGNIQRDRKKSKRTKDKATV